MKNRIVQSLLLFSMMVSLSAPSFKEIVPNSNNLILEVDTEYSTECCEILDINKEEIIIEKAISKVNEEMSAIELTTDKKEWFITYKEIVDKYSYILDPPETIYDYHTSKEIYLMQRVIETECYDQSFECKANVASVILNRVDSGKFGRTVKEVITTPKQFVYWRKNITEDTVLALEYAFEIKDTTKGCVAFRSDRKINKWNSWTYQFSDKAHHFYK